MRSVGKNIIPWLLGLSFIVNFIWENAHAHLYTHVSPVLRIVPYYLTATFADVLILCSIYYAISLVHNRFNWLRQITLADIFLTMLSGLFIATFIEKTALAADCWHYTNAMPIVPVLHVGLSPLLQLMIVPILVFYCTKKLAA